MIWGWIKRYGSIAQSWSYRSTRFGREFCPKPDTQEWNRLPKLVTLRTFPQLDAPGASKHPANKAARKPAVPGGVDVWASKNHPGGAFRKSAEAINGSMDWLNRKSAGNLGSETNPIIEYIECSEFSHHFPIFVKANFETSLAYSSHSMAMAMAGLAGTSTLLPSPTPGKNARSTKHGGWWAKRG